MLSVAPRINILILVLSLFTLVLSGCASRSQIQHSTSATIAEKPLKVAAAPLSDAPDTIMSADSFVDKYSSSIPPAPDCSEIEFLLNSAENSCLSYSYGEAHTLLRKALASIKEMEETGKEWPGADSYYNEAVRIYTEQMPGRYTDSIPDEISMLVFQKRLSQSLDTLKISPNDSIILKKLTCQKGISYNFPITYNDRVYRSLYFFGKGGKGPLDKWLLRSSPYLPFMQRMFADSGLPTDLAYLPLIESGFNPMAYSSRHASGIWQFIAATGSRYGLRTNYWLDERRDPVKSTSAAAGYLKKLFNQFNDWHLAVAAYNCGENSIVNALNRAPRSNYWHLSLPHETNNYVPEFISALIVAKNPECFGYPKVRAGVFDFDTLLINDCLNLQAVSDTLGIFFKDLRAINPHILHWCTPPSAMQLHLYLPKGSKGRLKQSLAQSPQSFHVSWYKYQVRPSQSLTGIASQFKVPLDALKSINKFDASSRLPAGQSVFIPIPVQMSTAEAGMIAEGLVRDDKPSPAKASTSGQIRYMVRSGDTVWELARLFHMSVQDICSWNNITQDQRLAQGQFLILYSKARTTKEKAAALPPAALLPANPSQARYEVLPGETLYSISRKLGIPVSELMALNGIDTKSPVIFAGQNLFYYPGHKRVEKQPLPDTVFYKICKGDNLFSLAQSFSVSVNDLMQANNISASSTLKVGDLIRIPVTKRAFSAPAQVAPQPASVREDHL
jgi:membrane-bound lytic murein transglycosylase D